MAASPQILTFVVHTVRDAMADCTGMDFACVHPAEKMCQLATIPSCNQTHAIYTTTILKWLRHQETHTFMTTNQKNML